MTPRHFAWQAWHKLTSTVVLRVRRGTSTVVLRGRRGTNSHLSSFCVAGVAQTHIYRRFAWQAWHKLTDGRRGTGGSTNAHLPSFRVVPTCFLPRFVCFSRLFTYVMFRHVLLCSGMSYGRSGMFYFPTCCLLRFVCSAGLFTHVLCGRSGMLFLLTCFPHWLISGMFNCFLLSVCFISIRICCQVLVFGFVVATGGKAAGMFTYLRRRHSLRSGMFLLSACFGMLAFLACLSTFFFRPAAFHTQLRPGAGLACGR